VRTPPRRSYRLALAWNTLGGLGFVALAALVERGEQRLVAPAAGESPGAHLSGVPVVLGPPQPSRPYRRLWIVESDFRTSGSMPRVDRTSATDVPAPRFGRRRPSFWRCVLHRLDDVVRRIFAASSV
jgi:hypothetical protein